MANCNAWSCKIGRTSDVADDPPHPPARARQAADGQSAREVRRPEGEGRRRAQPSPSRFSLRRFCLPPRVAPENEPQRLLASLVCTVAGRCCRARQSERPPQVGGWREFFSEAQVRRLHNPYRSL